MSFGAGKPDFAGAGRVATGSPAFLSITPV